jgi:hypothetical protein
MVENNPLPGAQQLASVGNFTTQASSLGGPRINGTFALSHQLFLGRFLLPMLQSFNKASIIYPWTVKFSYEDDYCWVDWNYAIGNDLVHQNASDEYFAFKPVHNPETPNDATAYKFSSEYKSDLSPNGYNPNNNVSASFTSTGTSQVDFTWNAGESSFFLTGQSVYKYDIEYAENASMQRPFAWLRYVSIPLFRRGKSR